MPPSPTVANRFKGLLPQDNDINWSIFEYIFIMKLPTEAWTRKVKDWFDEKRSFKDLTGECNKAHKHALSDRSNKRSRTQVNAIQDDDEEAEQEEEEQAAVNLVSGGASQQWKSKRARTDQGTNARRQGFRRCMPAPPAVWSQGLALPREWMSF